MKKRIYSMLLIGALAVSMISGCGKKKEEVETVPTETEEVVETETEENTHPGQAMSFFTGEWIDEADLYNRPVAVMVENTSAALPQYGLNKADVVYECPVEGGISRLMAIFQDYSGMEKIGNVRSCRHYYCYFAHEYGAIYIHAGESTYAKKGVLKNGWIDAIDGITGKAGSYFFRDDSKVAPHNYYTSSEKLEAAIEAYGYETSLDSDFESHFNFVPVEEPLNLDSDVDASVVSLYFQNASPYFVYNSEDGMYYRYEFGKEQVDGLDDSQVVTKNIIIQCCDSELKDDKGRLEIHWRRGGNGYYITNGKAIPITWTREDKNDKTHYFDANGQEITVNAGRTWVEICESQYSERNKFYSSLEEFEQE